MQASKFTAHLPPVTEDDITPELILAFHDHRNLVWMRDDYLLMRDIARGDSPQLVEFLDRVAAVKQEAKDRGYVFHC